MNKKQTSIKDEFKVTYILKPKNHASNQLIAYRNFKTKFNNYRDNFLTNKTKDNIINFS